MALIGAQFVNAVSPNPVGSLQAYAGASAPTGWLMCDGTSYSTSAYPELFSVLGYTYGGSGANFSVPDLRGRMPIGAGNDGTAANNATRTRGDKGGDTRLQSHNHSVSDPGHTHTNRMNGGFQVYRANVAGGSGEYGITSANTGSIVDNSTNTTGISVNNNGSGSGENMPPFLVTNYIIKAVPDAPRSGLAYGSTPPIVTALPANPQFGDVVTYIADAANGVAWNLQYDASGTYPWKFIGGAPLAMGNTNAPNTTSTSWATDSTTTAISVGLPGDYRIAMSCLGTNSGGWWLMNVSGCGYTPTDQGGIRNNTNASWSPGSYIGSRTFSSTGSLSLVVRVTAGTMSYAERNVQITPVRVKAA